MANYTELSADQVIEIASKYDLGAINSCQLMEGGLANSSFHIVADAGEYVATITSAGIKSDQETHNLINLLLYLDQTGFHTTKVIPYANGDYLVKVEGGSFFLKKYIQGKVIRDLKPAHLHLVGEQMAQLHNIAPPDFLEHHFSYGIEKFDDVILSGLQDTFVKWLLEVRTYIESHFDDDLPRALIHGDIFFDNVIVADDGLTITDFEEACNYYRIYDLGTTIAGTCTDKKGNIRLELVGGLLQGYQKINKLSKLEETSLRAFAVYGAAAAAFWRFRQYHIDYPEPMNQKRHLEMKVIADNLLSLPDQTWSEIL